MNLNNDLELTGSMLMKIILGCGVWPDCAVPDGTVRSQWQRELNYLSHKTALINNAELTYKLPIKHK